MTPACSLLNAVTPQCMGLMSLQGYKLLLEEYYSMNRHGPGKQADQWQATMLMVLPEKLNLAALPCARATHSLSYKLGVGFARLACQVVAWYLDMCSVWLLDDNVHGCWRMEYDAVLQQGAAAKHQQLLPISVTDMMIMVEQQVSHVQWHLGSCHVQLPCRPCRAHFSLSLVLPAFTAAVNLHYRSCKRIDEALHLRLTELFIDQTVYIHVFCWISQYVTPYVGD